MTALPSHYREEAEREIRAANLPKLEIEPGATVSRGIIAGAARAWDQTYVATDWALMLDLWRSIDPADKSLALEMADADRRRAQTRVRT